MEVDVAAGAVVEDATVVDATLVVVSLALSSGDEQAVIAEQITTRTLIEIRDCHRCLIPMVFDHSCRIQDARKRAHIGTYALLVLLARVWVLFEDLAFEQVAEPLFVSIGVPAEFISCLQVLLDAGD